MLISPFAGWDDTIREFAPKTQIERVAASKVTIGDYLTAAEAVFDGKPKTFRLYATYLRRIASDIFGINDGKARWDYREGGRDA
ncbi:MAG TPA: hypothetical protein VGI60_04980 [Chthoniobacterales bacterium]|jgi:hypothetical protein